MKTEQGQRVDERARSDRGITPLEAPEGIPADI